MFRVSMAIILLTGSACLMIGAIIHNQVNPNYSTALSIPLFNIVSIIIAIVGVLVSLSAYRKDKASKLAKRTMVLGIACAVVLVFLFPLSNLGYLSVVN